MTLVIAGGRRTCEWHREDEDEDYRKHGVRAGCGWIEDLEPDEASHYADIPMLGAALAGAFSQAAGAFGGGRETEWIAGPYAGYLSSESWRRARKRALSRAGGFCQRCRCSSRHLQVHHLTYDRLGQEYESDLLVVCGTCHEDLHGVGAAP